MLRRCMHYPVLQIRKCRMTCLQRSPYTMSPFICETHVFPWRHKLVFWNMENIVQANKSLIAIEFCSSTNYKTDVGTPKNPRPPSIHKSQHDYPLRQPITDLPTFEKFFFSNFSWKETVKNGAINPMLNWYRKSISIIKSVIYIYTYICRVLGITF